MVSENTELNLRRLLLLVLILIMLEYGLGEAQACVRLWLWGGCLNPYYAGIWSRSLQYLYSLAE